jgi:Tol biopolymer transport system component
MNRISTFWVLLIALMIASSCKKKEAIIPSKPATYPGTYILFDADENFNLGLSNAPSAYTSVYYCKLDGTGITAVTTLDPGFYSYRASWSADGMKVIFTRGNKSDSVRSLCIINVPGGNFTTIVQGHRVDYGTFSPDGKQIAYAKASIDSLYDYDVYIAKADGSGEQRLTYFNDDGGAVANLQWGADNKIYFNAVSVHHPPSIYTVTPDGATLTGIVGDVEFLSLSRDAKHILYDLSYGLFTCDADGSNVKKIKTYDNNTPNSLLGASWSADGTQIFASYTDYPYGLFGIYRMNSDGTGTMTRVLAGFYELPRVY